MDRIRAKKQSKVIDWKSLAFLDKASLFNKWNLFLAVGNLFTMFGSIFYMLSPYFEIRMIQLMIGLGCAINWIGMCRYLAHSQQYSIISRTLKVAVPINIKIMAGIFPIYIGYVLLAMSIFWNDRGFFSDFTDTAYTFFSMMNGDSILVTFAYTTK